MAVGKMIKSTSWLGFADYYTDGDFFCMGGGDMLYTNWGTDEPNNMFEAETDADFTVIIYETGSEEHLTWHDVGSYDYPDHQFGAVCQADCYVGYNEGCIPDV